jgi:alpha-glucosidase
MSEADDPWRGAAIYQIYPRSFADSNGDGVGDLPGITAHLDYVAALGVEAIWLSPFFPSPMADFGYDVSDYVNIDPLFGTLADFVALLKRAHALGLKVIIDLVFAHTSEAHAWFRESRAARTGPKADWFVWSDPKDDGTPPNNWQSVFGGPAWTWDARRGQYYLHHFLKAQPALNVRHPQVVEALKEVMRFWLDLGVDGFRLDALNYAMHDLELRDNPAAPATPPRPRSRPIEFQIERYNRSHPDLLAFVQALRQVTDAYPGRFTVAEIPGQDAVGEMQALTTPPRGLSSAYGFDFLYARRLTPGRLVKALAPWPNDPQAAWPSWAFSNHDAPRAVSRFASPEHRGAMARLSVLLLACLRGNIFLYQGEELGLPQAEIAFEALRDPEAIANWPLTLGRDGARTPMPWRAEAPGAGFSDIEPWLPIPQAHRDLAVDRQEGQSDAMLAWTRAVLALRRARPALRLGDLAVVHAENTLLAFERRWGEDRVLCVFNLGNETAAWSPPTGAWRPLCEIKSDRPGELGPFSGRLFEGGLAWAGSVPSPLAGR